MTHPPEHAEPAWDRFDPDAYYSSNYLHPYADDLAIARILREFFERETIGRRDLAAVDVGTGTNLYPALCVTPWLARVDFVEPVRRNRDWLLRALTTDGASWQPFIEILEEHEIYRLGGSDNLFHRLTAIGHVTDGSVERLQHAAWDIGLMFFVAESITDERAVFEAAVQSFVGAVKPGGMYAAAFMLGSHGYPVGTEVFPAVPVEPDDIAAALAEAGATDVDIHELAPGATPIRDGYSGIAVATARRP